MTVVEARAKADELNASAAPGERFVADYATIKGKLQWIVRGYAPNPPSALPRTWIAAR